MTCPCPPFEEKPIGNQIRVTYNMVDNYINSYLANHLVERLYGFEGMTLRYLYENPDSIVTSSLVAKRFNVSKATASQTLHRLEKKGYLKMKPLKEDKRVMQLVLTEKGKRRHQDCSQCFVDITNTIEKDFSKEERETLTFLLKKIIQNITTENTEEKKV